MAGSLFEQQHFPLEEEAVSGAAKRALADEIRQTVHYVTEHSHTSDRGRAIEEAGTLLAQNVMRLQAAVEKLLSKAPPSFADDVQKMSGIEEAKLLSSIEKWQRRYNELDGQHRQLAERYAALEEQFKHAMHENEILRQALSEEHVDAEKRRAIQEEMMRRVEKTIATLDQILS